MKYYKYKQVQRLTFFGFDDSLKTVNTSFLTTSPQTTRNVNIGTVLNPINIISKDTKILRFNINKLSNVQLSQNARIVIENLSVPVVGTNRAGPITVRMSNLNTNSHDSQNNGSNKTLIYTTEGQLVTD
jgi:hypothetical protein